MSADTLLMYYNHKYPNNFILDSLFNKDSDINEFMEDIIAGGSFEINCIILTLDKYLPTQMFMYYHE